MNRGESRRRVLLTGGAGFVGSALAGACPAHIDLSLTWRTTEPSGPADGVERHQVDLADAAAVADLLETVGADLVIHTAYTMGSRVDIVEASRNVARACARSGAGLIHLSTDVVFGGDDAPYSEDDERSPVSEYGRLKCEAEDIVSAVVPGVCITRTSLVVGIEPPDPATAWLLDAARGGREVTLFHDEIRSPISITDLSARLWTLVSLSEAERSGVWHLPGPEHLSRLQIGQRICAAAAVDPSFIRSASAATHPDPRPRDLTLRSSRAALADRHRGMRPQDTRIGTVSGDGQEAQG